MKNFYGVSVSLSRLTLLLFQMHFCENLPSSFKPCVPSSKSKASLATHSPFLLGKNLSKCNSYVRENRKVCFYEKEQRNAGCSVLSFLPQFFIFLLKFIFLPFRMLSRGLYFKTWTIYAFTFRHGWVVGVGRYIGQTSGVIYTAEGGNCPAGLRGWHYLDLNLHWQNNGNIAVHCAA